MSHSVEVTIIADQEIEILGEEINVHDLEILELDGDGDIIGYSCKDVLMPKYAGEESVEFWGVINRIEDDIKQEELYSLGCKLQGLEGDILKKLKEIKDADK